MTLSVRGLSKQFYDPKRGDFLAVDNVSFECKKGEIFGLLGPNGAGKTTTLRMIATILKPSHGTAEVDGHDICKQDAKARANLGFLSSETGLYDRLTPREMLTYFAQLSKYPEAKIESRVNELIGLLGMTEFASVRCEKLSTGTRQKVSIARAIVHDPPVMIFDEPTTGLDVLATQAMHKFIASCREQQKCILLSTHIMSEAERLCDRIGIIHHGKILANGTLDELRQESGQHYLEDIFVSLVQEKVGELI